MRKGYGWMMLHLVGILYIVTGLLFVLYVGVGMGLEATVSRQRRAGLRETLRLTTERLKDTEMVYFIDFGTLLGHVRDNDIIEHDIDVDFGLVITDSTKEDAIKEKLKEHLHDTFIVNIHENIVQCFLKTNTNNSVDFYVYRMKEDANGDRRYAHVDLVEDMEDELFPVTEEAFGGTYDTIRVPVPQQPERLLTRRYGKWRIPVSNDKGVDGGRASRLYDVVARSTMTWRDLMGIQKSPS